MNVKSKIDQYKFSTTANNIYVKKTLFRWSATVLNLKESGITLPGDVLLVSSFISYVGCFMRRYRLQLINDDWVPTLAKTNVSNPKCLCFISNVG